jgi:tetratricopeptide (TPR) repeat protein
MNSLKIFPGILVLMIFLVAGCTKKMVPGISKKKESISYDSTAFDYLYIEALKQKYLGNNGDALKYLEQCIRINPGSDAAYYGIAQIAFQEGDISNAKIYALKSVNLKEKNIWYLTFLANIYYQEKVLDSAVIYYEKAVSYFPERKNLKLTLGNIYAEKGDFIKANEIYKYFEKIYGENENISLFLVKNLMNSGDLKGAEEKVKALLEEEPDEIFYNGLLAEIYHAEGENVKALDVYKRLMAKDPQNGQTLLSFSDFLITEKGYDELFSLMNTIIINENITKENKISLSYRLIENEELIKTKGKEIEMVILVMEATYKNDDIVSLLRPELYQKEQKIESAIIRLEELTKTNPDNYYAWEKLLMLYSEKGDFDNLFSKGKECATKFNMSFLAKVLYASAALEKNELDIAQEELRKAEILAGDKKEMQVQVLTMKADLFYRKKEFGKCYETFKEGLKLNPEDVVILNNYAYYLAEQEQDLKEAERMAKIVVEKEKNNGTYLDTYAWILYKMGKIKDAAKIMEDIIKTGEKEDAEWCEHYGFILKAMKKCNNAVEYWKKAKILDKNKSYLDKEIQNCIN